ncbi:MAG: hypothetical protein BWK79_13210 [Beggiatoa sp. IS2]|nr:MAG: hypothetical protein BWK79_13210 [Beggiatoa sp. IS2]
MKIYTIGFAKKTAQYFFETLKKSGVKRIIDVRLYNTSQLAGFAKKEDLSYFLREICAIDYVYCPELAPTKVLLDAYKKQQKDWDSYADEFLRLMEMWRVADSLSKDLIHEGCLLCSEDLPDRCHRRLAAEYLKKTWPDTVEIVHLI